MRPPHVQAEPVPEQLSSDAKPAEEPPSQQASTEPQSPPAAAAAPPAPQAPPAQPPSVAEQTPTPVADVQHELLPTQPIATAVAPSAAYLQRPEHPQLLHTDVRQGVERLRGPAAKVVSNMEASLDVPTATSVRTVPAKLIMDNRVVMNNHLARTRGGKVSFTHLIGYAIVETLAEHPAMNVAYTTEDGKPAIMTPGTRQLRPRDRPPQARWPAAAPGAQHQERRRHGLRAVLGGVRVRRESRTRGHAPALRFPRHDVHPDKPRHHRHRPLRAAPHAGPRRDHRRGFDGLPGRVPGRLRRHDRAPGRLQGA